MKRRPTQDVEKIAVRCFCFVDRTALVRNFMFWHEFFTCDKFDGTVFDGTFIHASATCIVVCIGNCLTAKQIDFNLWTSHVFEMFRIDSSRSTKCASVFSLSSHLYKHMLHESLLGINLLLFLKFYFPIQSVDDTQFPFVSSKLCKWSYHLSVNWFKRCKLFIFFHATAN